MSVVVLLLSWAVISMVAGLWLSAEARKAAARRGEQDVAFTELLAAVAADASSVLDVEASGDCAAADPSRGCTAATTMTLIWTRPEKVLYY